MKYLLYFQYGSLSLNEGNLKGNTMTENGKMFSNRKLKYILIGLLSIIVVSCFTIGFQRKSIASGLDELGVYLGEQELYEKSMLAHKHAVKFNSNNVDLLWNLGIAYSDLEDYDSAIETYKKAIEINPNDSELWSDLGDTYGDAERYDDAINSFNKSIEQDPNSTYSYAMLAIIYDRELKDYDKAIEYWKIVLSQESSYGGIHLFLGDSYEKAGKIQDAHKSFEMATKLNPDLANEYIKDGLESYDLEDYEGAIRSYNFASKLEPERADIHFRLGISYLKNNDKEAALKQREVLETLDEELSQELRELIH